MTTEITWVLISKDGERRNLSPEMVFVGTHECEVNLKCKSVDKQHAVINFDSVQNAFRIKDLGSLNGTFVNETRLPEQIYITLKHGDQVRFGYGSEEFSISRIVRVRNLSQKERSSATSSKSSKTSRTSSSSSSSTKSSSAIKSSISFTVKSKSTTECPKIGKEEEASCASSKKSISVPSFSSKEPKKTSVVADGQSSDRSGNNSRTSQGSNETKRNLATSQSVENWFAMNRPVRSTATIPLETAAEGEDEDKEEETSPNAANKQQQEEELEVVWSFPVSEAGTNRQVKKEIAESDRKSSKNSSKKKKMKSKASSSSSSSSSSKKSTNASETGTYTVDEEELKATTDKKDKKKDDEVVDIDDEVSAARKEFVNEWINQHQITEKTSLKSDEMSSSSSGSQRVRRSLPAIPPSSVVHNKYPGSPKLTNGSSKRSERTSNDHRRIERGGDSKKTSSVRSTDRRNDGKNSIIKTESLRSSQRNNSNNKVVQEAPDSPGPLVRSGSFTMDKPSGLVPDSEIPNVSLNSEEKKKLPYKMTRSGSFTKEPGISQDLIPKIEDEKTNGGTASPKTSKKDFNSTTDKMSTISVTNGRNESATQVRESPRRALSNAVHKQVRRSQESVSRVRSRSSSRDRQSPVITNHVRNTAVSSPKPWLNQKPATPIPRTLTSDNERSKTPPTKIQRQRSSSSVRPNNTTTSTTKNNNYSSDCEPSGLRLTRTTLLRQSKAKDRTNKGGRQSYGNNSTTTTSTVTSSTTNNLPAREKKKVRNSTSERLNQLSKPPTRRLNSRTSGNESSDTEAKAGIRPGRRKSAANLGEKKRNGGKPLRRSMTSSNMESSEQRTSIDTNTSLGTKIVRQSRYNQLNDNGNSGRRRQQQVNPGRHRITNTSTSLTSESENEEIDDDIRRRVYERHRAVGLKPYGRSPPDGEMSDQIARYSNDLVRNLSLLSSKSVDDSTISDTTSNTTVILQPSNADSLEITSTILTNEPLLDNYEAEMAAVDCTNDRIQRKTWNSTQANGDALDSLMLSNVCALSVRLCAISDGLTGKIALLHARSAPYDTSKSQVPLLQQTSSQEMATLVNNLRHVESQLLRADRILDPDHKLRDLMHD